MKARTFTVPFSKVVGDDATELEFGPDDHLVVRPLFSLSAVEVRAVQRRIEDFEAKPAKAQEIEDLAKRQDALDALNTEAGELILSLMDIAVRGWSLEGESGPIPRPTTVEALDDLPAAVRGGLYGWLVNYRGEDPHPTRLS